MMMMISVVLSLRPLTGGPTVWWYLRFSAEIFYFFPSLLVAQKYNISVDFVALILLLSLLICGQSQLGKV